jgi:hypothetical protein
MSMSPMAKLGFLKRKKVKGKRHEGWKDIPEDPN